MIRAIDTLQKNFAILQKRQETTASNIANAQTNGFRSKRLFQSTLAEVTVHNYQKGTTSDRRQELGSIVFGNALATGILKGSKGALSETGREMDFVILQDGYFTIALPNGAIAFTRNGNFTINNERQYVTQDGNQVLNGLNKPVQVGNEDFQIRQFESDVDLINIGNSYYQTDEAGTLIRDPNLQRGYLETSNVEVADEMTALIQTSREFEANQKVLSTVNETLKKAVNEIGRI